jgi:hypothetical protein
VGKSRNVWQLTPPVSAILPLVMLLAGLLLGAAPIHVWRVGGSIHSHRQLSSDMEPTATSAFDAALASAESTDTGFVAAMCADGEIGEAAEGTSCVFPFAYKNAVYSACTTDDRTGLWCATAVDADGISNEWGGCMSCHDVTEGSDCVDLGLPESLDHEIGGNCAEASSTGGCSAYPDFAALYCSKSCGLCNTESKALHAMETQLLGSFAYC